MPAIRWILILRDHVSLYDGILGLPHRKVQIVQTVTIPYAIVVGRPKLGKPFSREPICIRMPLKAGNDLVLLSL